MARAKGVLSLLPPSAIGERRELLGPCHSPGRNIDYWILLMRKLKIVLIREKYEILVLG